MGGSGLAADRALPFAARITAKESAAAVLRIWFGDTINGFLDRATATRMDVTAEARLKRPQRGGATITFAATATRTAANSSADFKVGRISAFRKHLTGTQAA